MLKFNETGDVLLRCSYSAKGGIKIPNGVTEIDSEAFRDCTGLTSVQIPNGVTRIGEWAFEGCTGLKSIKIPSSITSIGVQTFAFCSCLTSVEIPNSVTFIGLTAFNGCTGLHEIHMKIEHIENVKIDSKLSSFIEENCTLYVPIGTGYAYRHHPVFGRFKHVVIER